jgi:hypothetical protein
MDPKFRSEWYLLIIKSDKEAVKVVNTGHAAQCYHGVRAPA